MKKLSDEEWSLHMRSKPESGCGLCNDGDLTNGGLFTPPNWCDCPLGKWWEITIYNMNFEVI